MKLLDSKKVISVVSLWVALGFGRWPVLAATLDNDIYNQINWAQQSARDVSDRLLSFVGSGEVKEAYYRGFLLSPLKVWCLGNGYFKDAPGGLTRKIGYKNKAWLKDFFDVWSYWQAHRTVVVTPQQQPISYQLACTQVNTAVKIEKNSRQIQDAIRNLATKSQNKQKKESPTLSMTYQQTLHRGPEQLSTNNQGTAKVTYKDPVFESVLFNECNDLQSQQKAGLTVTILQDTHLYDTEKLKSLVDTIQKKRPSKKSIIWLAGDMLEKGLGNESEHEEDRTYWHKFTDFVLEYPADEVWLGMGNHDGAWPATYLGSVADLCQRSQGKVKFISNVMDTETLPALRPTYSQKLGNNGTRYVTIGNVAFIGFSDAFPSWGMGTGSKGHGKALSQGADVFTPLFIHQMCNNYGGIYRRSSCVGLPQLDNDYQNTPKTATKAVPGCIDLTNPLTGYPGTEKGTMNRVGLSCLKCFKDAVTEIAARYATGKIYVVVANHNDARNYLAYLNRVSYNIVKDDAKFQEMNQEYLLEQDILGRTTVIVDGGHVHNLIEDARGRYWNCDSPIQSVMSNGVYQGTMPIFYGREMTQSSTGSQLETKSVYVPVLFQNVKGGHDCNPQNHSALVCSFMEQ